jgi:hypothetical protein
MILIFFKNNDGCNEFLNKYYIDLLCVCVCVCVVYFGAFYMDITSLDVV